MKRTSIMYDYGHVNFRGIYDESEFLRRLEEVRKRTTVIYMRDQETNKLYGKKEFVEELCQLVEALGLEVVSRGAGVPDSIRRSLNSCFNHRPEYRSEFPAPQV